MLTKTLKFDDETLNILRGMVWENEGRLGIIAGGQLDRALYVKVNKALEAMGGKWNRKAGGHIFSTDPRAQVEGLLETNTLTVTRDGFFETPPRVISRMLELAEICEGDTVLEPSAGLGAIASSIEESGFSVAVIEKNEQRAETLKRAGLTYIADDFLRYESGGWDKIIMNPPFEELQDIDHVRHAYSLLSSGGRIVSVMGEGPFFRADRKAEEFRVWLESVGGYSERLPKDSFKDSGTGVNTRLVVIDKRG